MKELLGQDKSEFNVWFVPVPLDDAGLSTAQFRIYAHLARRSNKEKGCAWPGIDSMALICQVSRRGVIDSLQVLEKRGMIEVRRKPGKGNIYILTRQSSWVTDKLPTDRSSFCTGAKKTPVPVQNQERKVIQEGNLSPAGGGGEVINNQADRIATLFKRRKNTPWSPKEVTAWKKLTDKGKRPLDEDDLVLIEQYYLEARRKSDNYCRRDLYTFLNNFGGEVDRAREWCDKHPRPGKRKARPIISDEDLVPLPPTPDMNDPGTIMFVEKFERQFHRLPAGWTREGEELVFHGSNGQ